MAKENGHRQKQGSWTFMVVGVTSGNGASRNSSVAVTGNIGKRIGVVAVDCDCDCHGIDPSEIEVRNGSPPWQENVARWDRYPALDGNLALLFIWLHGLLSHYRICSHAMQPGMRKRWISVPLPLPLPPKCSCFISSYRSHPRIRKWLI